MQAAMRCHVDRPGGGLPGDSRAEGIADHPAPELDRRRPHGQVPHPVHHEAMPWLPALRRLVSSSELGSQRPSGELVRSWAGRRT